MNHTTNIFSLKHYSKDFAPKTVEDKVELLCNFYSSSDCIFTLQLFVRQYNILKIKEIPSGYHRL